MDFPLKKTFLVIVTSNETNLELQLMVLVVYLVKCWKYVIGKLHFCDGGRPCYGGANAEPRDALLAQGGVEDTVLTVLVLKTNCTSEKFKVYY